MKIFRALEIAILTLTAARVVGAQQAAIPTDGLELWVKADGPMQAAANEISVWSDASGNGRDAVHDDFGRETPTLASANGKPTLRFSGERSGFHFPKLTNIRTVFAVLSKDSKSCLPTLPDYKTPAKFWLGGAADPTYFHPEHGCAIYNSNLSEVSPNLVNGKTFVNGKPVEGRKAFFPFELGLLSIVATGDVSADTIARDRGFQDRSWQGDISELLIYSRALDDATRVGVENVLIRKYALGGSPDGSGGAGGASGGSGGSGGSSGNMAGGGSASGGSGGVSSPSGGAADLGGAGSTVGGAPATGGAPASGGSAMTSAAGAATGATHAAESSANSGGCSQTGSRQSSIASTLFALFLVAFITRHRRLQEPS